MLITNERFKDNTVDNLKEININEFEMLLKTVAKNAAPAITISALKSDPDEILLVVPADAKIENMDRIPSESIDYAVMEKSKKIKVVPSNFT